MKRLRHTSAKSVHAQVLLAGGSSDYCAAAMSPAGTESFLVDVTPGDSHSLITEQLAFPRVVSLTLLLAHALACRQEACDPIKIPYASHVGTCVPLCCQASLDLAAPEASNMLLDSLFSTQHDTFVV